MKDTRKFPVHLITRTAPYPRYEMTAAYDTGEAFRHFRSADDVQPFMARHGYHLCQPNLWHRDTHCAEC